MFLIFICCILSIKVEITRSNAADYLDNQDKPVMIKLYNDWCSHCKSFAPVWDKFVDEYDKWTDMIFASIECSDEKGPCSRFSVDGVPSVVIYYPKAKKQYTFNDDRTIDALGLWLFKITCQSIIMLNSFDQLNSFLEKNRNNTVFVCTFMIQNKTSLLEYYKAARKYLEKATFFTMMATINQIDVYHSKDQIHTFNGSIKSDFLTTFIESNLDKSTIKYDDDLIKSYLEQKISFVIAFDDVGNINSYNEFVSKGMNRYKMIFADYGKIGNVSRFFPIKGGKSTNFLFFNGKNNKWAEYSKVKLNEINNQIDSSQGNFNDLEIINAPNVFHTEIKPPRAKLSLFISFISMIVVIYILNIIFQKACNAKTLKASPRQPGEPLLL